MNSNVIVQVDTQRRQSCKYSPIEVTCRNLCLSVPAPKARGKPATYTAIINDVSARFQPGRLTAIMGASGAGKTSLLNILAGDVPKNGKAAGDILVNGHRMQGKRLKKLSGFVFQDDLLLETMTVREAILMSARLRMSSEISIEEKCLRTDEMIDLLGLEKARNTVIGSEARKGISGGERKRTSIAMEIVTNPAIIFLDEPTSGLDTFTSFTVVSRLKALAEQGRTVVATIHQPSSEVFHMFDDLLLLAKGRVVYCGPVEDLVEYLSDLGFTCPRYNNPADYVFMEVLNNPSVDKTLVAAKVDTLITNWEASSQAALLQEYISCAEKNLDHERLALDLKSVRRRGAGFVTQFLFLGGRAAKNCIRNFMLLQIRLIRSVFMGLLVGLIYWNIPSRSGFAQYQVKIPG